MRRSVRENEDEKNMIRVRKSQKSDKEIDKRIMRRNDLLLAAVILSAALFVMGLYALYAKNGAYAVVYVNGEKQSEWQLSKDTEVLINGTNRLVIRSGEADMTEADCPDRLCVKQHAVRKNGESIVCLPNRIVVMIEGGTKDGVDAVVH